MNKPDFGEPWEIAIEELDEDCKTIHIPQIDRVLHDSEWAEPEKYQRDLRNAKRIVACVNACAGLSDEDLKAVPHVRELIDALRASLSYISHPEGMEPTSLRLCNVTDLIESVIAKAEGREGQDED